MASLEKLKQEIKEEASNNPEKFFATDILKEKGFHRSKCSNCGMQFWSFNEDREVCGEPECGDGYTFINNSPTSETFSYAEAWETYKEHMTGRGYKAISRYPVVARWRDDVEFVGGSIYNFQPYVVSGEAEPPAPELIVPQPSLRFNDIENVGITGRHYVLHNHIGQTCFQPPKKYDQDRYFKDMFEFAVQKLGIPKEKLILHEDAWGGGGNLGACMEFFVDGLELWNQVYMFYEQTPTGYEELDLKVLDMGMGHERITWISHGTETSYECVMPETVKKMKKRTGLEVDRNIWEKFLPHSSELNVDEVEDIEEKWKEIAEKIGEDVDKLKDEIKPAAALYSVAEHMRALIFALADGKIPSNTGGGHNLRIIYRRSQDFIERYNWDLDLVEVAEWNAKELEPIFPELIKSMEEIEEILEVEKKKYQNSRQKALKKLQEINEQPTLDKMIELYESHGVSPDMMEENGIDVPEDFYSIVSEEDETVKQVEETFNLDNVSETKKLYYQEREPYIESDSNYFSFEAKVEAIVEDEWIVLDQTHFYPEGGGQAPDTGHIVCDGKEFEVTDVQKQGGVVVHRVSEHELSEGDEITAKVDSDRRKQLTQHHTSTHIVNAAAKAELGNHIYQAGARKTEEKGRLDITHYEKLTKTQLEKIEKRVRKIIEKNYEVTVKELAKSEAEQKYGFRIYQGGAPPGNNIRLIKIGDIDIEACGGTHLKQTENVENFYITDSKRIQDGVIRLEYKAGNSAEEYKEKINEIIDDITSILDSSLAIQKISENMDEIVYFNQLEFGEKRKRLEEIANVYSTEIDKLPDTIDRFSNEVEEQLEKNNKLREYLGKDSLETEDSSILEKKAKELKWYKALFESRKWQEKQKEELEQALENKIEEKAKSGKVNEKVPTNNIGLLIQLCRQLANKHDTTVTLVCDKGAVSASTDNNAVEELEKIGNNVQGDERFAKTFDLKKE